MPKKRDLPSDEKAKIVLDAVEDRLAENPVLLDVRGKTLITDFFLICTGTSEPHLRAITESVLEKADEENLAKPRVEGRAVGEWVLMDFGDVVLHIMNAETRERYKLEEFWTTPQPKGALPPTPDSVAGRNGSGDAAEEIDEDELDALDLDDEDLDDAAFFDDADQEVEPIDEEDIELVERAKAVDVDEDFPGQVSSDADSGAPGTNGRR